MRMFCTIIALVLIAMVSSILLLVNFWLALVSFPALTITFVYNAIQMVPANPPHKGILVFLGKRQKTVLDEGWNYVPFYPVIFNFILIKVEKVVQDLEEQIVRTPDLAEIGAKISLAWLPGIGGAEYENSLINYLNTGGENGVRKNLNDMIEDRLRTWAASNQEGPSDWVEAMASKDEALEVLLKAILGDSLPKVESDIPTTAWMKYFSKPKRRPTQNEIKMGWSPKDAASSSEWWAGLQTKLEELEKTSQKILEGQVKCRMEAVRKIKEGVQDIEEGQGMFNQRALGITILRFTVNEISVKGQTAKAAESDAKEKREARGEAREIINVSRRIQKLQKNSPKMSLEEAIGIVQIQQGKISESVIRVLGASTGLGQDVLAALGVQRMSGGKSASDSSGKKGGGQQQTDEDEDEDEYEKKDGAAGMAFEKRYGFRAPWDPRGTST